eukprot:Lankesteria_metandrocarpae@DN1776_c0_g1_i1.p1
MSSDGAYLTFNPASNGSLFIQWSKETVADALMFASPTKTVPVYKYKGKTEIVRNMQADKKVWYRGIVEFIKLVRMLESSLQILPAIDDCPMPTRIVCISANGITKLHPTSEPFPTKSMNAVVAIPRDNSSLDVKSMSVDQFLSKGTAVGHSLQF